MISPLLNNLEELTDDELQEKIRKAEKVYFMTTNPQVQQQIVITLDSYKLELEARNAKKSVENSNKDLDNLININ